MQSKLRTWLPMPNPVLMILAATCARLLPHPPNVTPLVGLALFSGAQSLSLGSKKSWFSTVSIPLLALFLSDLVLGLHPYIFFTYGSFALITLLIGRWLSSKKNPASIATASLISSLLFFIVTNFGVWALGEVGGPYPKTIAGLIACYVAGIPFFGNALLGDLFFSGAIFGVWALWNKGYMDIKQLRQE